MVFTKRYNLINNAGGWLVFVVALVSYLLTLEPTASYWDCGEFIIQADKLEIGHPPGNPIFMLTARFFANFATDASHVALMVNAMSGLLSALTILLLFWTITHFVRKLTIADGFEGELPFHKYAVIMGSGVVGALAYAWSDTFWFSAVEAEVYAYSSFCTALVVWLILKWENRADEPHSDRYLILIAYIIGISVAVHLLNLLCIPAIVLVFAYKRLSNMNLKKSLLALLVSFGIIVLVLYGLVPGFIKTAQFFELTTVNTLSMGYHSGTLVYTLLLLAAFGYAVYAFNFGGSDLHARLSVLAVALMSGIFTFAGVVGWVVMFAALIWFLFFKSRKELPRRVLNTAMWSIVVIFLGYSSYALILIRSNADTPMNQNSPDNLFALSSYLNREQYGVRPLLNGATPHAQPLRKVRYNSYDVPSENGEYSTARYQTPVSTVRTKGAARYSKGVAGGHNLFTSGFTTVSDSLDNAALEARGGDFYAFVDYNSEVETESEMNMLFTRMYSSDASHIAMYEYWCGKSSNDMELTPVTAIDIDTDSRVPEMEDYTDPQTGEYKQRVKQLPRPSFADNLRFFFDYQINHMYMRYFMWNFAGRQNDICNQRGELDAGNWISGFSFIDNTRLGDQSLLPEEYGDGNRAHNVFYMLPLVLGIIGLLWQAFAGQRGIKQFWVVFFLFFMTGIAIVLYLNQTPLQPRERDYAFAGSFYAFAIWIGMGVAGMWHIGCRLALRAKGVKMDDNANDEQLASIVDEPEANLRNSRQIALAVALLGLIVPLQMVSQTWDDHDRSHRRAAFEYAANYLNSLEKDAIIFCNGDNDTFPLWYAQEVEGVRRDVRIINLSYLSSDWYADQMQMQAYESAPVPMQARSKDYAYDRLQVAQMLPGKYDMTPTDALKALRYTYSTDAVYNIDGQSYLSLRYPKMYIPVDKGAIAAAGNRYIDKEQMASVVDKIEVDVSSRQYMTQSEMLMLDIIATNAATGWKRPIYWAMTVPDSYYLGLSPYMREVGMVYQLTPVRGDGSLAARGDKSFEVIDKFYRWGLDKGTTPYFDETARRMLSTTRTSIIAATSQLLAEGDTLASRGDKAAASVKYGKAKTLLDKMESNLPQSVVPHSILSGGAEVGVQYTRIGRALGDKACMARGLKMLEDILLRYSSHLRYALAMRQQFLQPSLSYETAVMPEYYYQYVDDYIKAGGDFEKLKKRPEMAGLNFDNLKQLWQQALSGGGSGAGAETLLNIRQTALYVKELEKMSAEEYARQSPKVLMADSLFFGIIYQYLQEGGSEESLLGIKELDSLDLDRSSRLFEQYCANHPE